MRKLYSFALNLLLVLAPLSMVAQLPWPASSPAPDSYGYTWKTNSDPSGPAYIWEDISAIGTLVTGLGDDGNVGPINMGIDFPFYWYTRNEVWIADNGFIAFSPTPIGSGAQGFPPTPTASEPNDVIAPYMVDMNPTGAGNPHKVYYYADTANNRFIVSWENMPYWVQPTVNPNQYAGSNSFQVILDANDSSITFNYKELTGAWSSGYDGANYPFVVGIENVTGTFGMMPPALPNANPASLKPVANTAIKFYSPTTASPVTDIEVSNVQNDEIQAFIVPWAPGVPPAYYLYGGITNVGNTDILAPIPVSAKVVTPDQLQIFDVKDTAFSGLAAGETRYFKFNTPLPIPFERTYSFEVATPNPSIYGDLNSTNDVRTNELLVVDTSKSEVVFTYASGNNENLQEANGGGLVNWSGNNGNSGIAVYYDSYGYPVSVKAIELFATTGAVNPQTQVFLTQIYGVDPSGAIPGPLLYSDTVFAGQVPGTLGATTPWVRVDLDSAITIDSLGFYVAWIQGDSAAVYTENAGPISRRSFEILGGGWSIWRSNSTEEVAIRAIVNVEEAEVSTAVEEELANLKSMTVYPNPSDGMFTIHAEWNTAQPVELKVFDLTGRKVYLDRVQPATVWDHDMDLSHLDAGMYLLQLASPEGTTTTRLVIH